jgi:hypothetical protein
LTAFVVVVAAAAAAVAVVVAAAVVVFVVVAVSVVVVVVVVKYIGFHIPLCFLCMSYLLSVDFRKRFFRTEGG